jgi:hypothetical protein
MWIALSCRFEQLPGRVDPDCGHTGRLEHSAEAALATTNIEGGPKPAGCDAAEHDGIQHMLPRPIAPLAYGVDPRLRRAFPPIVHDAARIQMRSILK